jgi:major membrane immunogen (membrane-anchored lipoprotein)
MTRIMFRKMIIQSLSLLAITIAVLLVMNVVTNQRIESQRQAGLKQTLGTVLPAERYSQISLTPFIDGHPNIQSVYKAYDTQGTMLGFVIDVKDDTETGDLTTRMSFSSDGSTLIALCVLDGYEAGSDDTDVSTLDFFSQFQNVRVPLALLSDLPEQDLSSNSYPPISGLTDGTFREQQAKEDNAGYKDYVEIVVSGGRITQVTWDAVQTDGGNNRAKASVDGEYVLTDNKVIWAAQAYAMQNKLIEVQDPAKIAIKSDGTTEIVPDVTIKVNAFVTLANKCIEDSKNGQKASGDVTPGSSATATPGSSAKATPGSSSKATPGSSAKASPTTSPLREPTPTTQAASSVIDSTLAGSTSEDSTEIDSGSEDGVVQNKVAGSAADTIDGLAISEIKTKINEIPGSQELSRAVVTTANQAFLFLKDYLKGGS